MTERPWGVWPPPEQRDIPPLVNDRCQSQVSTASKTLPGPRALHTTLTLEASPTGSCVIIPAHAGRSVFKSHREACRHRPALGQMS